MKFKYLVVGPSIVIFKVFLLVPQLILMCSQGWEPLNKNEDIEGEEKGMCKAPWRRQTQPLEEPKEEQYGLIMESKRELNCGRGQKGG